MHARVLRPYCSSHLSHHHQRHHRWPLGSHQTWQKVPEPCLSRVNSPVSQFFPFSVGAGRCSHATPRTRDSVGNVLCQGEITGNAKLSLVLTLSAASACNCSHLYVAYLCVYVFLTYFCMTFPIKSGMSSYFLPKSTIDLAVTVSLIPSTDVMR